MVGHSYPKADKTNKSYARAPGWEGSTPKQVWLSCFAPIAMDGETTFATVRAGLCVSDGVVSVDERFAITAVVLRIIADTTPGWFGRNEEIPVFK